MPAIFFINEQHVEDYIDAMHRVQTEVAVEDLFEVDDAAALFRELVDDLHHLNFRHKNKLKHARNAFLQAIKSVFQEMVYCVPLVQHRPSLL